jgi:hypothetical protein
MKYFNAVHCKDIINMGYILSDFGLREFSSRTYIYRERELTVKTDIPVSQVDDKKNIIKTKSKARSFTVKSSWNKDKEKAETKSQKACPSTHRDKKNKQNRFLFVRICIYLCNISQILQNAAWAHFVMLRTFFEWLSLYIYSWWHARHFQTDFLFLFFFAFFVAMEGRPR